MSFQSNLQRMLIDHTTDLLLLVDEEGRILFASPSSEAFIGESPASLENKPYNYGVFEGDVLLLRKSWESACEGNRPITLQYRYNQQDGGILWVESVINPVRLNGDAFYSVMTIRNISEQRRIEGELARMAYYDPLTGLPNRRLFQDRYHQALLSAKRYERRIALLYLDLDDFKSINDTYGHNIGDQLLKITASRLINSLRDPDTVCRLGGDEFIVLLQQFEANSDIEKIARRMIDSLSQLIYIQSYEITIGCSIGAAIYPDDSQNGETLMQMADSAMYMSKKCGKNCFQLYH
ncbi:sensor domain-containing diguanylate cyclase [Paenibacillus thalictri]|uniref:Sensor domain-containing diguanylate cyclase n=1 Tax=Paenibacillus thalictri TaxID=2527873 RepID=A0A4Q9DX66_9BACL|nr:sensor domain-containing diguanylate cyclase [Paenibacillus thalictri]TBL81689.1 sensor domain-containing diguanylate cyclase [Paenibacillus thalictri]